MQNLHNLEMNERCLDFWEKKPACKCGGFYGHQLRPRPSLLWVQAMTTAMKASKKIRTAPATGITMGMCLTIASTGS